MGNNQSQDGSSNFHSSSFNTRDARTSRGNKKRFKSRIALALLAIGAIAASTAATAEPLAGTGVQYKFVSPASFTPYASVGATPCLLSLTSGFYSNSCLLGSGSTFVAPLDLPEGSLVSNITFWYYDNSPLQEIKFHVGKTSQSMATTSPTLPILSLDLLGLTFSSGVAGASTNMRTAVVSPTSPFVYDSWDNSTNPATHIDYSLFVDIPPALGLLNLGGVGFSGALVTFNRQIAPAPAAATFDDVPTTHPFFNEVQQLSKSGITLGCGNNNYCPDSPVTRGQMAAFLSRAFGLQWDSNT